MRTVTCDDNKEGLPPADPSEEISSQCSDCGGTGLRDLGGFHPWGEAIMVECGCGAADSDRGSLNKQKSEPA